MSRPALIALDWGTSALRAWCLDGAGQVLDQAASEEGIMRVPAGGFAALFARLVDPWRAAHPSLPAIACGMVGAAQGWAEAPYQPCPAGPAELSRAMLALPAAGLHIVPGVAQRAPMANVMRGEETQIAGALQLRPELADGLLLLPGTHAKWVTLEAGRIAGFVTYMTGELFAVLKSASILGRFVTPDTPPATPQAADEAFAKGLAAARDGELGARLFSARAEVLLGNLPAAASLDYLSGLLIGAEIASVLATRPRQPPVLIGAPALVARYRRALAAFGWADGGVVEDAARLGLWRIASAAGLVQPHQETA